MRITTNSDERLHLSYTYADSPVGPLLLVGDTNALHSVSFSTSRRPVELKAEWQKSDAPFVEAIQQLNAYFAGDLREFDLSLHLSGTGFQNRVWRGLATIPFGETRSYGQMAEALQSPSASRAVGAANGHNPLAIILPCHRVIGANGTMTGFGGGLPTKVFLLDHEAMTADAPNRQLSLF